MASPLLVVDGVDFAYAGARVLSGVSVTADVGEVVCLLGMNGAGKSTLLALISGLLRPRAGRILLDGQPLPSSPAAVVAAGVVQVPEGRQVFAPLSVRENLEMGAYLRLRQGQRRAVDHDLDLFCQLFPVLGQRLDQPAGNLSGGEQQMLALARGLMARPRLLLLDEPSLGLAPQVTAAILRVIRELPGQGCGALLVEQNALGALAVSQRGYILTSGRIRHAGAAQDILADELLREAFLGPPEAPLEEIPHG